MQAQRARRLWRNSSDLGEAYRLVRLAEEQAFPDGPYQLRLVVLHVMAGVCLETGRLDESAVASQRLVALTVEAEDRYVEASARLNVASYALQNPDRVPPGTAMTESELALQAAEEVGNVWVIANAQCVRAEAGAACRQSFRIAAAGDGWDCSPSSEGSWGSVGADASSLRLVDLPPERGVSLKPSLRLEPGLHLPRSRWVGVLSSCAAV